MYAYYDNLSLHDDAHPQRWETCACQTLVEDSYTEPLVVLGWHCELHRYRCVRCGFVYLETEPVARVEDVAREHRSAYLVHSDEQPPMPPFTYGVLSRRQHGLSALPAVHESRLPADERRDSMHQF